MVDEVKSYKFCVHFVRFFLTVSGLWPGGSFKILKKLVVALSLISNFVAMVVTWNFCFHNYSNVALLSEGLGLAIGYTAGFIKVRTV